MRITVPHRLVYASCRVLFPILFLGMSGYCMMLSTLPVPEIGPHTLVLPRLTAPEEAVRVRDRAVRVTQNDLGFWEAGALGDVVAVLDRQDTGHDRTVPAFRRCDRLRDERRAGRAFGTYLGCTISMRKVSFRSGATAGITPFIRLPSASRS